DSMRLLQESRLPHNTYRSRHDLVRASEHAALTPLGSEDYMLIGELSGHGNRQSTFDTLIRAMNEKAAIQGGDALLVYSEEAGLGRPRLRRALHSVVARLTAAFFATRYSLLTAARAAASWFGRFRRSRTTGRL